MKTETLEGDSIVIRDERGRLLGWRDLAPKRPAAPSTPAAPPKAAPVVDIAALEARQRGIPSSHVAPVARISGGNGAGLAQRILNDLKKGA